MKQTRSNAFLTDQALALLDASDQIKNIRAARTNTVGIRSLFKYTAISICSAAIAGAPLVLLMQTAAKYFPFLPTLNMPLSYGAAVIGGVTAGLIIGGINFRRDRRNYRDVLVPTVMRGARLSRAEADIFLRAGDRRAAKAFNAVLLNEPRQYLHNPETRRLYEDNKAKLKVLRTDPTVKRIKLANGTRVGRERFAL